MEIVEREPEEKVSLEHKMHIEVVEDGKKIYVRFGPGGFDLELRGGKVEKQELIEMGEKTIYSLAIRDVEEGKTYGLTIEWDKKSREGIVSLTGPAGDIRTVQEFNILTKEGKDIAAVPVVSAVLSREDGEVKVENEVCLGPVCVKATSWKNVVFEEK